VEEDNLLLRDHFSIRSFSIANNAKNTHFSDAYVVNFSKSFNECTSFCHQFLDGPCSLACSDFSQRSAFAALPKPPADHDDIANATGNFADAGLEFADFRIALRPAFSCANF
jgi:hypothetical protein